MYIIISIKITFGGTRGPVDFCKFSDIICDTINDLLDYDSWNESKVCSDFVKFIPPEEKLDKNIPFGKALGLKVKVPVEKKETFDVYIDDFIGVTVDINNNKPRLEKDPFPVIHVISHTLENDTFLSREKLIKKDICKVEGDLSKTRIYLGWLLDTRKLYIQLPLQENKAWINDLKTCLLKKRTSHDNLRSLIGKLENVVIIIKMMGHFMNNLYALELKSSNSKHNIRLSQRAKEDAKIHIEF